VDCPDFVSLKRCRVLDGVWLYPSTSPLNQLWFPWFPNSCIVSVFHLEISKLQPWVRRARNCASNLALSVVLFLYFENYACLLLPAVLLISNGGNGFLNPISISRVT